MLIIHLLLYLILHFFLQRESLKSDLDSKLNIIFQNYGQELEQVQQMYERDKHDPPIPRNLPPVAGNITWSRHLLKRIEEPMKQVSVRGRREKRKDGERDEDEEGWREGGMERGREEGGEKRSWYQPMSTSLVQRSPVMQYATRNFYSMLTPSFLYFNHTVRV
jgi:hypothetical protein